MSSLFGNKIPDQRLLAEVDDALRTMPSHPLLGGNDEETLAWIGRASAIIEAWDLPKSIAFSHDVARLASSNGIAYNTGVRGIVTALHQARHALRMKTVGPVTVAVSQGAEFHYFDEVRQVIETAKIDLLFVDAYLDAEFVTRYLPHVSSGVKVRLLTRLKLPALQPAVALWRKQNQVDVEVRSGQVHDRYVFVDRQSCYQSGASFKDGAKSAPTTLTQITDAFSAVSGAYEAIWAAGVVQNS
jgi:hypothetical protein